MHADTHSLYQSQGFCQRMCQRYQSYFSVGQSRGSQIPAEVALCRRGVEFVVKRPVTCAAALACSHFFYFQSKPLCASVRLCLCGGLCVRYLVKEHRSLRQCRGLWQRKQIFVPLPPTGNCSYTHRTPLSSHMLTHTQTPTGSVIMLYGSI